MGRYNCGRPKHYFICKWEVAPSADAFIERAESLESPYSALSVYEQGIEFYPLDYRFHEGINKNLNTILSWAMSSHQRGIFPQQCRVIAEQLIVNGRTAC